MRALFFLGVLGLAGVGALAVRDALTHYEEPDFQTDLKDGAFEIRSYPSVVSASVQVAGKNESSANNAFKILAGYIFGKNKAQTKIAMTTPVLKETHSEKIAMTVPVTVERSDTTMTMSFYMPSKFSLDTLPEPLDKRIELSSIPPRKFAVIRFSGFGTEKNCGLKEEELERWMEARNLKRCSESIRAFYNPPWALPFLRRNEIWIPL